MQDSGVLKNSAITFASMVFTTGLGIVSKIILTRSLGPAGNGQYTLITLIPSMAFIVGSMGINVANIYLVGSQKFELRHIISNSLTSALLFGSLCMAAGLGFVTAYHSILFGEVDLFYLQVIVVAVPFVFLLNNFSTVLQGKNLIAQYNLIGVVSSVVSLASLFIFLVILRLGLPGAIVVWVISTLVNVGLAVFLVSRLAPIRLVFPSRVLRDSIVFGVRAYLANLFGFLVRRVDVFLVASFLGATQLGFYSLAFSLGEMLWYLASSVSTALSPVVASSNANDSGILTSAVARNVLFVMAMSIAALLLIDRYLIEMAFGKIFLPSVIPLRWLLPGILAASLEKVLAADLIGRGRPTITMVSAFVALVVNIGTNLILIPRFGISGASMASSIAYSVAACITLVCFLRITTRTWREPVLITLSDLALYGRYLDRLVAIPVWKTSRKWKTLLFK